MENFRYWRVDKEPVELNGPLFYSDMRTVMIERSVSRSNQVVVISIERPADPFAEQFWRNQALVNGLTGKCKIVRLSSAQNSAEIEEFGQLFAVTAIPSLFVFGPASVVPSFVHSSTWPDPLEFQSRIESLVPIVSAKPAQERATQKASDDIDEFIHRRRTPKPQARRESPQPKPQPQVQPKPKPQQETRARSQGDERPIRVRMIDPNGKTTIQNFKPSENVVAVRVWVSRTTGQPHTNYDLFIEPGNEPLPFSDRVTLERYAPDLTVRVVLKKAEANRQEERRIWHRIKEWLSDFSFIADADGDPTDFWRPYHPAERMGRVPAPQARQQQQPKRSSRIVRGADGIHGLRGRDDIDEDRNQYDNGNGNAFQ